MKTFTVVTAVLAAGAAAKPVKRAAITDAQILNYALTLEHLEDTFYRQGLKKFTENDFAAAGYDSTFYSNLKEVSYDETTHVQFLTAALNSAGVKPVKQCTYDFGVTDVHSFIMTASILEGVGVSAYLGAAASIANKDYLTAAGSILTIESRHSSYLRAWLGESSFPQPFDAPLDFDEVYTLAAPFIVKCPSSNPPLPVKAFPSLSLYGNTMPATGATIELKSSKAITASKVYAAFIAVTGPTFVEAHPVQDSKCNTFEVTVPAGFHGQSYVVLTTENTEVTDDTVKAGPAILEVQGTSGGN